MHPWGAGTGRYFYNLDALRPNRVEDALATERYALDAQLAPLRLERFSDGSYRWRSEPKLSYGILPFTELEVRAPLLYVDPRSAGAQSEASASARRLA